ncbi:MAG: hypothetical protein HDS78_09965 [Bacteroidales bacterium]|nr:hypothetical protein [Bacteroidales bacterium]
MTLLFPLFSRGEGPQFREPDFDYPVKVEADARALLAEAQKQEAPEAGRTRLRALVELFAAQSAIDRDSAFTQPAKVAAILAEPNNTPADRAMLLTLQARLYWRILQASYWKYSQVDAPLTPLPADVSEWSADQFKAEITRLITEALAIPEAATTPLSDYSASVSCDSLALIYLPTVRDFILLQASQDSYDGYDGYEYAKQAFSEAVPGTAPYFYWAVPRNSLSSTHNELLDIYKKYSSVEAARYVLQNLASVTYGNIPPNDYQRSVIEMLRESLNRFPDWAGNNDLKAALARLTAPCGEVTGMNIVAPGVEFEAKATYCFAKSLTVSLHYVGNTTNLPAPEKIAAKYPAEATQQVTELPEGKCKLKFTAKRQGAYVLLGHIVGEDGKSAVAMYLFESTPYVPVMVSGVNKSILFTAAYADGAPYGGVQARLVPDGYDDRRRAPQNLGTTTAGGFLDFKPKYSYAHVSFTDKGSTTDFGNDIRCYNVGRVKSANSEQYSAIVLTDRPIYHPGDSLNWAVVVAAKADGAKTLPGTGIDVELRDANGQTVDTVCVTTDANGRASGTFIIPKGKLTGRYTLVANHRDDDEEIAINTVMVSDFRAPVFYAEVTTVQRDVPSAGCVRIQGRARTFSGMPVANAKVAVRLEAARRWWRYVPQTLVGTYDITTDADGAFTIDFSAETLTEAEDYNDKPYTDFIATFDVTAPDASTASVTKNFSVGKPYSLNATLPATHDASAPLQLTFKAYNADGNEAPLAVKWEIYTEDAMDDLRIFDDEDWDDETPRPKPVAKGTAICGTPTSLNLAKLPAGEYGLVLVPKDTAMADTLMVDSGILIYNVAKNQVPETDSHFFLPKDSYQLGADGSASVQIGVRSATTIYTVLDRGGEIVATEIHTLKSGFSNLPVALGPVGEDFTNASLMLICVHDGRTDVSTVQLTRPALPEPRLVAETFRNKLMPGNVETWRIRLLDSEGNPMAAVPAIATMYNRSLEQLVSGNWRTAFNFYTPYVSANLSTLSAGLRSLYMSARPDYSRSTYTPEWPEWRYIYRVNTMMRKFYGARAVADTNGVMEEKMVTTEAESAAYPASSVAALTGRVAGVQNLIEVAELSDEAAVTTDEDGGAAAEPEVEFREAEVLQAFWMPSLVADAEGNIDLVFTVPNANATWTFRSLAWTPDARTAALALEALANKPVMVQPNMPRFLRQGDMAYASATVYNNSGAAATVYTSVEVFNPATGEIIGSAEFADSIAADASALVNIGLPAATDASSVGYRVRSRLGSFTDGEQGIIPILPSSATVIESTEFYLNPGDAESFTLSVPAAKDATITLQYCQNPVWTVVRAMRGLGSGDGLTSTSLVGKLFSSLAARSIIAGNPAIASAISEWSSNPDSRALESMLSRNEVLKKLMLDQTPWVQTATDQSARMAALVNVLHPDKAEAAIRDYVEKLVKLQSADGGIRWTSWASQPSAWATRTVLTTLGIANSLSMLPTDNQQITELVESAWAYVCADAARPKVPDTDFDLAYIAAMLPGLKSDATTEKIISRTVDAIRAGWKGSSVTAKAYDVLILKANGLEREARPVFESIRQFAVDRPGMGKCFPNITDIRSYATIIQAYKAMGASDAEIDRLRQWVIVQAQASDDLFAYNPDYVIAAVMLTGTDWTAVPVAQNVRVDGRPLEISNIESATGYFAQALRPDGAPLTITVTPNGVTPSYGSVISISERPMASIQARPGRDVSIEKRVLVQQDGKWVETNYFTPGQRLRVQLTIKAKRALDYVTIDDERPAAFEPVDQLPGYVYDGSLGFYRENLDASTRLFIGHMPAGTYHLAYDMTANVAGSFISGIVTLQSQYAPELTAHSSATTITVE